MVRRSSAVGSSSNPAFILSPVLGLSVFPADAAEVVAVVAADVEVMAAVVSAGTNLASISVCLTEPSKVRIMS